MHGSVVRRQPPGFVPGTFVVPCSPRSLPHSVQLRQVHSLSPSTVSGSPQRLPKDQARSSRQTPNPDASEELRAGSPTSNIFQTLASDAEDELQDIVRVVRMQAAVDSARVDAARCFALTGDIHSAWRETRLKSYAAAAEAASSEADQYASDLEETQNVLWDLDEHARELHAELRQACWELDEERLAREVAERRCMLAEFQMEQLHVVSASPVAEASLARGLHKPAPIEHLSGNARSDLTDMRYKCQSLEVEMQSMRTEFQQLLQNSRFAEQRLQDEVLELQKQQGKDSKRTRGEFEEQQQAAVEIAALKEELKQAKMEVLHLQLSAQDLERSVTQLEQSRKDSPFAEFETATAAHSGSGATLQDLQLSESVRWLARERELVEQLQRQFQEQLQEARQSFEGVPSECTTCEARRSSSHSVPDTWQWQASKAQVEQLRTEIHERLQEAALAEQQAQSRRLSAQGTLESLQQAGILLVQVQDLERAERQAQESEQVGHLRSEFHQEMQVARASEEQAHVQHASCQARIQGLELQLNRQAIRLKMVEDAAYQEATRQHDELETQAKQLQSHFQDDAEARRAQAEAAMERLHEQLQAQLRVACDAERSICQEAIIAKQAAEAENGRLQQRLQDLQEGALLLDARLAEQRAREEIGARRDTLEAAQSNNRSIKISTRLTQRDVGTFDYTPELVPDFEGIYSPRRELASHVSRQRARSDVTPSTISALAVQRPAPAGSGNA